MIDKELIKKKYPYPIATYFAKMQREELLISKKKSSYQKLFLSVIDAFEITLRFLGVIVIKEYLDAGKAVEAYNELLVEKLFKKMSLGDWLALFREGSRCLAQEENLFFPELNAYAVKRGSGKPKSTKIMESFDRLITVRNRFKGHSTNCTEKEYQELYEECLPHIEAIWEGLAFLVDYDYVAVKTVKGDHVIDSYQKMNGSKDVEELEDMTLEGFSVEEGDFLVLNREGGVFNLSPLLYFYISYEEEEEHCCLYEENATKNGFFKMIHYLGILPNNQTWHFKAEEDVDDYRALIEQFNRLFACLLGIVKKDARAAVNTLQVEDYYFKMQKSIIEHYTKTYFPREKEESRIAGFLKDHDRGYFEIVGVPGQGKTALMCTLIERYSAIHHLICGNAGRDDEQLMVRSLLAQAYLRDHDIAPLFPEDVKSLEMQWTSVLYELSEKSCGEKIVVVIDALDELNGNKNLGFMPQHLPENVYVIYSMRPIRVVRSFDVEESCELTPFSESDVYGYVRRYHKYVSPEKAAEFYEISGGNPLFLKCLLENERKGEYREGKLPKSLVELLDRFVDSLRNQDSETACDLFGLIAVSPGGLSIKTLARILGVSPMEVKDIVDQYRQYLMCVDRGYRFFHKRIYEHLLKECEFGYGEDEIIAYHQKIVSYCEPVEEKRLNYGYRYILYHLYRAGAWERLKEVALYEEYESSLDSLLMEIGREESGEIGTGRFYMYLLSDENAFFRDRVLRALKELTDLAEFELVRDIFRKYDAMAGKREDIYRLLLNLNIDITHLRGNYAEAVSMCENYLSAFSREEILQDGQLLRMQIRKIHHSMFWLPVDGLIEEAKEILEGIDRERFAEEESELLFLIGGNLGVLSGNFEEAKIWVDRSYQFAKDKHYKNDELRASRKVAELLCAEGKPREAAAFLQEYVSLETQIRSRYQLYQLIVLAECYRQAGETESAELCYEKGVLYAKKLFNKSWEAHAYMGLALLAAGRRDDRALDFVKDAETIYRAIDHRWGILMSKLVHSDCLSVKDKADSDRLGEVKRAAQKNNYRYIEKTAEALSKDETAKIKLLFL